MAVTNGYATVAQLRSEMSIPSVSGDANPELELAIEAASRAIDEECHRFFYTQATATARVFRAGVDVWVDAGDFHTTTGLVIETDDNDDGTYETLWTLTDYQVEPLVPEPGYPWDTIVAVGFRRFPTSGRRGRVKVTARWGWAAVPKQVEQACLILARRLWDRRQTVQGVLGFGEAGFAVRLARTDPDVARLISPFDARPVTVA